ncbi:MAG TPA: hypothetical protein VGP24_00870 [Glaciihabitans sp.]|jgi:hypothetical protein|nr:hypothetical protein [Glaciihabitans sp.]
MSTIDPDAQVPADSSDAQAAHPNEQEGDVLDPGSTATGSPTTGGTTEADVTDGRDQ